MENRSELRPLTCLDAGECGEVALTTLLDAALLHGGGHLGTLGEVVLRASRDEVLHGRGTAARVRVEVVTVLGAVLATAHTVRELAPTTGTGVPLVLLRRGEETLRTAGTTLADLAADGEEDAENEDDDDDGDEPVASLSGEGGRLAPLDEEVEDAVEGGEGDGLETGCDVFHSLSLTRACHPCQLRSRKSFETRNSAVIVILQ